MFKRRKRIQPEYPLGRPFTDEERRDTQIISAPALLGLIIGIFWSAWSNYAYDGQPPENLNQLATSAVFFIWGFSPLLAYRKQFFPLVMLTQGPKAQNVALVALIACWGIALYFLIMGLR